MPRLARPLSRLPPGTNTARACQGRRAGRGGTAGLRMQGCIEWWKAGTEKWWTSARRSSAAGARQRREIHGARGMIGGDAFRLRTPRGGRRCGRGCVSRIAVRGSRGDGGSGGGCSFVAWMWSAFGRQRRNTPTGCGLVSTLYTGSSDASRRPEPMERRPPAAAPHCGSRGRAEPWMPACTGSVGAGVWRGGAHAEKTRAASRTQRGHNAVHGRLAAPRRGNTALKHCLGLFGARHYSSLGLPVAARMAPIRIQHGPATLKLSWRGGRRVGTAVKINICICI